MGLDKHYRAILEDWHCVDYVGHQKLDEKIRESWFKQDQHRAISEWCCETLKDNWTGFAGRYYFKDQEDLAWFTLRWL